MKSKIVFILCVFIFIKSNAQSGPEVGCINCEQFNKRTMPLSGVWYNPQQSGTGFSIEVQNRKVFGIYYGYDENGQPLWLTFVGDLQDNDNPEIMWSLEAQMKKFENGNCLNCEYNKPTGIESTNKININFNQKNHAHFSVNQGEVQNIVPITFVKEATAYFPEETSYLIPDLLGTWTFLFDVNQEVAPGFPWQWGYFSYSITINSKNVSTDDKGNTVISYVLITFQPTIAPPPEGIFIGFIKCSIQEDGSKGLAPMCEFEDAYGLIPGTNRKFIFTLGGIGLKKMFGETTNGHTFEATRIDYTDFGEIPSK